eukprot:g5140.t1
MVQSTRRNLWCRVRKAFSIKKPGTQPIERWAFLQSILDFSIFRNTTEINWGTPKEVAELDGDIKEVLKIEGLNPDDFFVKEVSGSVVAYYLDLHQRLYDYDIDLFASLYGRIKATHPLVEAMKKVMDDDSYKGKPYDKELLDTAQETPSEIMSETQVVNQRVVHEGMSSPTPPVSRTPPTFGHENRTMSWAVKTTQLHEVSNRTSPNFSPHAYSQESNWQNPPMSSHSSSESQMIEDRTSSHGGDISTSKKRVSTSSRLWRSVTRRFCFRPEK